MIVSRLRSLVRAYPITTLLLAVGLIYSMLWFIADSRRETIPDFASHTLTEDRKAAFNSFMHPLIIEAQQKIIAERHQLHQIAARWQNSPQTDTKDLKKLEALARRYYAHSLFLEKNWPELFEILDKRIYPIPSSVTMAQAALESGWGTSWLARNGNNLFGMRCFTPGCGMQSRWGCSRENFSYSRYATAQASVDAYMLNLNRHRAYQSLRKVRHNAIRDERTPDSLALIGELIQYAEEGEDYIRMLRRMLRDNSDWLAWD